MVEVFTTVFLDAGLLSKIEDKFSVGRRDEAFAAVFAGNTFFGGALKDALGEEGALLFAKKADVDFLGSTPFCGLIGVVRLFALSFACISSQSLALARAISKACSWISRTSAIALASFSAANLAAAMASASLAKIAFSNFLA